MQPYWPFRDDIAVIDGISMKGRRIIMLDLLQQSALNQLHVNPMDIAKTGLLASESIHILDQY